jgi:transcriptional regulator with XRE-family HTH domain
MSDKYGSLLKHWRKRMKLSQLQLALNCDVSAKHISFLETGRAQPSRDMIYRLAKALSMSEQDISTALKYAGIDQQEENGHDPSLDLLKQSLNNHNPYPAIITSQYAELISVNDSMFEFLTKLGLDLNKLDNPSELLIANDGFAEHVANDEQILLPLLKLIKIHYLHQPKNNRLIQLAEKVQFNPKLKKLWESKELLTSPDKSSFPLHIKFNDKLLKWKLLLLTSGTPRMLSAGQHILFLLFPADENTKIFCHPARQL